MKEEITTSAEYPKIELGGTIYEVKFTRGLMYRLDKMGLSFSPTFEAGKKAWSGKLSNMIDVLKEAIGFEGSAEALTELCYDKRDEVLTVLVEAWGKGVLPSLNARVAALSAAQANAETNPTKPQVQ
jgi:hypothetical protein